MTLSVQGLAAALQTLLTDDAETAAKEARLILRRRKLTGADFVQTLVFGWLANPKATLDDLAVTLRIRVQSLQQRFNSQAVDCLQRVLKQAMGYLVEARPETIPLLRRFSEVCLEDSTTVSLPASLAGRYPGCGGADPQAGRAALKVLVQLEAITGRVRLSEPVPARDSDRTLPASLPVLPPKSLRLVDLGFFDLKRMARETEPGIFWISRVPARLTVRRGDGTGMNVALWLQSQTADRIDTTVTLGTKDRLTCRMVAVRTPEEIAAQRRRRLERTLKKKGRKLRAAQRILCAWTVMVTNLLDPQQFTPEQLWVLYRVRWQVELLFKRWKSGGGLGPSRGRTPHRVLCEVLAKWLGVLITHWATLLRGGPLSVVSATRAGSCVRRWAARLAETIASGEVQAVVKILELLKRQLDRLPRRPKRVRPTTRQLLFSPRFATY